MLTRRLIAGSAAYNERIRSLVAVLVGTGVRLDEADIDLQHRVAGC